LRLTVEPRPALCRPDHGVRGLRGIRGDRAARRRFAAAERVAEVPREAGIGRRRRPPRTAPCSRISPVVTSKRSMPAALVPADERQFRPVPAARSCDQRRGRPAPARPGEGSGQETRLTTRALVDLERWIAGDYRAAAAE
jgi:hypothetical protein